MSKRLYEEVRLFARTYHSYKRNYDLFARSEDKLYIDYIEKTVNILRGLSKIIIENEIIKNKDKKWFYDYMSAPTYYRIRKKAYVEFLNILDFKSIR